MGRAVAKLESDRLYHEHTTGSEIITVNNSYDMSPRQSLYLTSLMYSYSKLGIPQPGTYTSSQLGDPEATDHKTKGYI